MGDRAVIALKAMPQVGVYLHWAGNPASVQRILNDVSSYARSPGEDPTYAFARLVEAAVREEGERQDTGVGVGPLSQLDCDNGDNGLYWIGNDWSIVEREHVPGGGS